ncbi:uncharacterized protein LOC113361256 [Papaver somniferum]|uniref:uncharacterized protein LOC113361256 n=1 Tax=Papaver somniferum TaxID=3469 RepID=UPI000E6FCB19|nr:uncharacterized protein LOC113361256 [Papaver somniferum]
MAPAGKKMETEFNRFKNEFHSREGPYISGKAEDGSDIPLPEKFSSSYQPWKFELSEAETKKVTAKRDKTLHNASASQNNKVKSLGDKTSSKGKYIPKRPTSKSSSKTTSTMDDLSRKRKRYDSSSSSESSEDDISVSDDSSIPSSLKESLRARLSYVISSDHQRRLTKLEKENAKLKAENSTNSSLIRRARERNDELIDLYNLSDEAANLPDGETLLEHLNSSLNNYPNQGFENLNLEELRLKYASLRKSHRSLLTTFNNFKHRLHEIQEQIQVLETKKIKLIDEKDEITLKGAKALEKFQESIVEVQKEHKEKNYLQKIEELETRLDSEEEKNYPQKIEELETHSEGGDEESEEEISGSEAERDED